MGIWPESIKRSASDRLGDLVPQVRARTSPGVFSCMTWRSKAFVLNFLPYMEWWSSLILLWQDSWRHPLWLSPSCPLVDFFFFRFSIPEHQSGEEPRSVAWPDISQSEIKVWVCPFLESGWSFFRVCHLLLWSKNAVMRHVCITSWFPQIQWKPFWRVVHNSIHKMTALGGGCCVNYDVVVQTLLIIPTREQCTNPRVGSISMIWTWWTCWVRIFRSNFFCFNE